MSNITMSLEEVAHFFGPDNIGLSKGDYPIFDEGYRETLNRKIFDRYQLREIAHETPEMFRLSLRRKMNEIMPYYNKLYLTEQLTFDPFVTIEMLTDSASESTAKSSTDAEATGTARSTSQGDSTTNSENTSNSKALNLDYPQQQLNSEGTYATSGAESKAASDAVATASENGETESTNAETSKSESEQLGTGKGKSSTKGFQGSRSALLMEYRQQLLNIDLMIIEDIRECFLMVWDHGGTYYPQPLYQNRYYI